MGYMMKEEVNPFIGIINKRLRADRLLLKEHIHKLGDNFYYSLMERLDSGRELTPKQRGAVKNSEKREEYLDFDEDPDWY